MEQTRKISRKVISIVLSLLMVFSCFSGMSLTALAIAPEDATWSANQSITENTDIGKLTVNTDITVTIAEGKTVTVHFGIDASDHTLTVAGAGTLVVKGKEGNKGNDNGDNEDPNPAESGASGESGVTGNLVVNGATVQITGGNGGDGGNAFYFGGSGGSGGNGVQGNVTVIGGAITITGGNGGTGGQAYAGNGSNGTAGRAVTGTISGDAEESAEGDNWIAVSADTSTARYVKVTAPAPAEDGPLVGTVIKVGDTLTLDGDYIEVMPGVIDQATDSFKLERMKYDDYFNGWGAVFEEAGAFLIAGDKTPEPDGFYVSGGNGTQSHPYTLALHYASSAYADYLPAATDDATALAAKVVKFNGYDWYLIEDNSTSATEGTVTLFAKDTIGSSRFNNSNNVYSESMVKSYLDNLTAEGGAFADVADAIVSTDLEDVTVTGAKLWLLSKDEVITTYKLSTALNKCSNDWWLRTPATSTYVIFVNGESGSVDNVGNSCMNTYGVRPALQLDLSKVEFNSETNTFALPQPLVEYTLWVGGVKVTNKNASNIDGNNKASYDAETNTLTLNGYTNSGTARADIQSGVNNAAIYYNDNMSSPNPLTIQLAEGTTNSLTMTGDRVCGIYVFGSALTITGNGTLNVQSDDMAINDAWGVAITGGTVNAASGAYYGIGRVTIGADISSVTITGKLGAIYGGSNEEQELINAVAGTGWTDVAGTTGQAAIATSTTGQNVSSYKKVYFTPHTHDFTYSANGATITATCTADGCTLDDGTEQHNHAAFITLNAPESLTYDGSGKPVTVTFSNNFESLLPVFFDDPEITLDTIRGNICYYKNGDKTAEPSEDAIAIAGTHTAELSFKGQTAGVTYTIAKADPTCTAPTGLTATYGQTLADVTLTNPTGNTAGTWAWADSQTSVGNVVTPAATFKASFVPTDTTNYNTVTNIDVTVTVGKANITPTVSIEGWTYGETANTPSVTGNTGEGAVTYTYAVKGSDNFSETVPTAVNDYTVKASIAATDNYKAGTATADFAISKAAPTVTAPVANKLIYNGKEQTLTTAAATEDGKIAYALGTYETIVPEDGWGEDVPSVKDAGTYYVWYRVYGDGDHSDSEPVAVKVTIEQAKVTITADNKSSKREAALKALTYTVDGEIYEGDDLGIEVSAKVKAAVAGKYVIKVAYTENANYDVTVVDGTYTVTDRITANERTKGKNKINSAIKATVNKNGSITAKWGAVANAEKFEVYATYCDGGSYKMIKSVDGNVHSFNITKINKKALNQKKSVKLYVVAYRKVNGKYEKITQSINLHVAGAKAKKSTNAKAINVKKDAYTLGVNKTATIKPTLVLEKKNKKAIEHVAKFRYQSTNTAVATVDANGKITAVGKGTCTIYIFANNGKLKSVKVTVK